MPAVLPYRTASMRAPREVARPRLRACLVLAGFLVQLAPLAVAQAPRHEETRRWVIPPGQESLVSAMLGESIAGCTYTTARVEQDHVVAQYACAPSTEPFTVSLHRRGPGACPGTCTEAFHIELRGGSEPDGFAAALAASVAEHEAGFRFVEVTARVGAERPPASERRSGPRFAMPSPGTLAANTLIVLVAGIVVFRLVRRSRQDG